MSLQVLAMSLHLCSKMKLGTNFKPTGKGGKAIIKSSTLAEKALADEQKWNKKKE
jgi:hypothetical protein